MDDTSYMMNLPRATSQAHQIWGVVLGFYLDVEGFGTERASDPQRKVGGKSHNHPSGDPKPSKADIDMTKMVRDALAAVAIKLHDHVVVGRKGHASFKALGLL